MRGNELKVTSPLRINLYFRYLCSRPPPQCLPTILYILFKSPCLPRGAHVCGGALPENDVKTTLSRTTLLLGNRILMDPTALLLNYKMQQLYYRNTKWNEKTENMQVASSLPRNDALKTLDSPPASPPKLSSYLERRTWRHIL
jgi:hypothetical protein